VLPYLNSLHGDFVFDDLEIVRDNPFVNGEASATGLLTWSSENAIWYRPLTMFTYVVNHRIDAEPLGFHVVNVLLHALVSVEVLYLARVFLPSAIAAAATALLFAVHPIHTEAVSNIVGRAELLAAAFVLASLLAFKRAAGAAPGGRIWWRALSVLAFTAALFSKESALTAIPLLVLLHFWIARGRNPGRLLVAIVPYLVSAAAYLGIRLMVIGVLALPRPPRLLDNPLAHVPAGARLQTAAVILWDYVALLAVPWRLSADYSYNAVPVVSSPADPHFVAAAVGLALVALAVLATVRRTPVLGVSVLLFALPLLLTANILFPIGTIKAERLLYLPSLGWCLALGWLMGSWSRARPRRGLVALLAVVVVFAGRTWVRNDDWRDYVSLFEATAAAVPASAKAHHNLGVAYHLVGRWDDAMMHFRRALDIYPLYASAACGIGQIYERRRIDNGALHWYARALEINPGLILAHQNTGVVRFRQGDLGGAESAFRAGLERDPTNARLLVYLATVRIARGDFAEAQAKLNQARELSTLTAETGALLVAAQQFFHQVAEK
jgi:Flp pilus assembly protein TadD